MKRYLQNEKPDCPYVIKYYKLEIQSLLINKVKRKYNAKAVHTAPKVFIPQQIGHTPNVT